MSCRVGTCRDWNASIDVGDDGHPKAVAAATTKLTIAVVPVAAARTRFLLLPPPPPPLLDMSFLFPMLLCRLRLLVLVDVEVVGVVIE